MIAHDIEDFIAIAFVQGIDTKGNHPVFANDSVQCRFVVSEGSPVLLLHPNGVAGDSHAIISPGQGLIQFVHPGIETPSQVKCTLPEVPLMVWNYLHLASRYI